MQGIQNLKPNDKDLLDLGEFVVLQLEENEYDYLFSVETLYPPNACPNCLAKFNPSNIYSHGRQERIIRDTNLRGKRVGIKLYQKRYRCRKCNKTFFEELECIDERSRLTLRLKKHIQKLSLTKPFLQIADEYSIFHTTVENIFAEYTGKLDSNRKFSTPEILGIDEVHLNREMRAVFCDIKEKSILDILENRNKPSIIKFLNILDKDKIAIVTCDMWKPYHDAVKTELPNAMIIVDKFHVIQYANKALDSIRKSFKDSIPKQQKRQLIKERFVLLKNKEDLTETEIYKRDNWFNSFPILRQAYDLKEGLRDIYKVENRKEALELFQIWGDSIPSSMPNFSDVHNMINKWQTPIFNYFEYPITNAYVESANNLIKCIEKSGKGYGFKSLRMKVLYGTSIAKKPKFGDTEFKTV